MWPSDYGGKMILILILGLLFLGVAPAAGVELHLKNGDRLTGEILKEEAGVVILATPYGTLRIPREDILPAKPLPPAASPKEPWRIRVSVGLEHDSGNTDYQSYRAMVAAKKKWPRGRLETDVFYEYALSEGVTDKDRLRGDFFYDYSLAPRLSFFTKDLFEVDKEADLDLRLQGGTGLSYYLYGPDESHLQLLFGLSFDYEDYRRKGAYLVTRALLGAKGAKRLAQLNLEAEATYQPKFSQPEDYQFEGKVRLGLPLLKNLQFSLRLEDLYRSRVPEGTEKNDLKILSTLDWLFEW